MGFSAATLALTAIALAAMGCGRSSLGSDGVADTVVVGVDSGVEAGVGSPPPPGFALPPPPPDVCVPTGAACGRSLDCCGGTCEGGRCLPSDPRCLTFGEPCNFATPCCGALSCRARVCGRPPPPPPQCAPSGAACGAAADCCNGLPCAGGVCGGPRPLCKPDREACASAVECCAGQCSAFVCGGPFACPAASGGCGACIAARCCQEEGVCLLEGACTASFACFNACRAGGGGFGCANECLSKPPTQAENNMYACGFQKCVAECQ